MAAEDYHADFYDPPDPEYGYNKDGGYNTEKDLDDMSGGFYDEDSYQGVDTVNGTLRRPAVAKRLEAKDGIPTPAKVRANKFYIASPNVFRDNWGHPTMEGAIEHAQTVIDADRTTAIAIVQIIRVVKRQAAPVLVTTVPGAPKESTTKSAKKRR
jgi:hypothetical protein